MLPTGFNSFPVIHGIGVVVYCTRAIKEYSQFLGAHIPISMHHANKSYTKLPHGIDRRMDNQRENEKKR